MWTRKHVTLDADSLYWSRMYSAKSNQNTCLFLLKNKKIRDESLLILIQWFWGNSSMILLASLLQKLHPRTFTFSGRGQRGTGQYFSSYAFLPSGMTKYPSQTPPNQDWVIHLLPNQTEDPPSLRSGNLLLTKVGFYLVWRCQEVGNGFWKGNRQNQLRSYLTRPAWRWSWQREVELKKHRNGARAPIKQSKPRNFLLCEPIIILWWSSQFQLFFSSLQLKNPSWLKGKRHVFVFRPSKQSWK